MKFRHVAAACAAALATTLAVVPTATADPPTELNPITSPLSAVPGTMWQTNKTVWALAYSNGVIYAGGSFTSVRPPGSAMGSNEVAQSYLAAFDATTGEFLASWRPTVTGGDVQSLDVSPDGTRLYVGGSFTHINGSWRGKIAAFNISNPTSPVMLSGSAFKAAVNGKVNSIDSTDSTVWVGGTFTTALGQSRPRVAAFSAATGEVAPFRVDITESESHYPQPFVQVVKHMDGRLVIGGMFNRVNGAWSHALGVVNASTGARDPQFVVPTIAPTSWVVAATVDNGRLFVSGRDDHTGDRARLEGVMALNATNGSILWGGPNDRCMGDTFALTVLHGILWAGTHAHDCSDIGGYPELNPRFYSVALGQGVETGDPVHFYPDSSGSGSVPGSRNNARAFATDGVHLWVAGGWTAWDGVKQQNLVKLSPRPASDLPKKTTPSAETTSSGKVELSWVASTDRDNHDLTYQILRNDGSTPIGTVQGSSSFWDRPTMSFVDEGVNPGDTVFYKLRITDGESTVTSFKSNTVTVPVGPVDYREAVLADAPSFYWRLDDSAGSSSVSDASGNGWRGNVNGTVYLGQTGALTTQPNGAAGFVGGHIATATPVSNPLTYSMELWFRTNTTSGGKLIGLGSSASGTSSSYDRHVYMTNGGRLVFGVYTGSTVTITSPSSYNDSQWHHMVATQGSGGMRLYVDGVLVGSNAETRAQNYTGYVRVGRDNLNGWPERPTSDAFVGYIDEPAYYGSVLSAQQVAQHVELR